MRIGLLNVQHIDNYGALLVAYSMQKVIESMGYEVETIDFQPVNRSANQVSFLQRIASNVYRAYKSFGRPKACQGSRHDNFMAFRKKYLKRSRTVTSETLELVNNYDAYIVGSDVIWKPSRVSSNEAKAYFLQFVDASKRKIAYGVSLGTNDLSQLEPFAELYKKYLKGFDFVSLREKESILFINRLYEGNVDCVLDPTMLLDFNLYNDIAGREPIIDEDYILIYQLGDNKHILEVLSYLTKTQRLKVCSLTLNLVTKSELSGYTKIIDVSNAGPKEFLNLIKYAKIVLTDSFHGTLLSVVFDTPFYTFSRGNISFRMHQYLQLIDLTDRYIDKDVDVSSLNFKLETESAKQLLSSQRKHSFDYLKKALADCNLA